MMGKKKILVVDDEQHVRQLIGKVLEKEGYEVLTACNGEDWKYSRRTTSI